jgi:response regulator of citrate/malate metabolism
MKDDIKKSSEVGFLKHLIKPISFQVLTAAIYECMMSRPQQGD